MSTRYVEQKAVIANGLFECFYKMDTILGEGGFGSVVKAQYAGDGQFYAIKMAALTKDTNASEAKQEALNFADMNHHYIVRYYDVWIEEFDWEKRKALPDSTLQQNFDKWLNTKFEDATEQSGSSEEDSQNDKSKTEKDSSLFSDITKTGADEGSFFSDITQTEEDKPTDKGSFFSDVTMTMDDETQDGSGVEQPKKQVKTPSDDQDPKKIQVMFLKMELCTTTLQNLIYGDEKDQSVGLGLPQDEKQIITLLTQILEGLCYIHDKKHRIHCDLKPANIFIKDNHVVIGDFGLAMDVKDYKHHKAGTPLYMAPEIFTDLNYSAAIDIYALGVILFEMCYGMKKLMGLECKLIRKYLKPLLSMSLSGNPKDIETFVMEEEKNADQTFKQRLLTSKSQLILGMKSFVEKYPHWTNLILWLLTDQPKQRPTAEMVLNSAFCKADPGVILLDQKCLEIDPTGTGKKGIPTKFVASILVPEMMKYQIKLDDTDIPKCLHLLESKILDLSSSGSVPTGCWKLFKEFFGSDPSKWLLWSRRLAPILTEGFWGFEESAVCRENEYLVRFSISNASSQHLTIVSGRPTKQAPGKQLVKFDPETGNWYFERPKDPKLNAAEPGFQGNPLPLKELVQLPFWKRAVGDRKPVSPPTLYTQNDGDFFHQEYLKWIKIHSATK